MIEVEVSNRQATHPIDEPRLISAATNVLRGEGVLNATLSIAVVDKPTIHQLNRQYLSHDYPADVLSFLFERTDDSIEGEVITCAEVAADVSGEYGWQTADELLLYVIHGVLHLVGYDDQTEDSRVAMRRQERIYLEPFDLADQYATNARRDRG